MIKKGLIFALIALIFLGTVYSQENDVLRVRVNTDILGEEGLIINLTGFLGRSINYYLVNQPSYVSVKLYPDLGIAIIKPQAGKQGTELILITTNESLTGSIEEKIAFKDARIEFKDVILNKLNTSFDILLDKALIESIERFDIKKQEIDFTEINFSDNNLFINLGDISVIDVNIEDNNDSIILRNIGIEFFENEEDIKYLYYEKEKTNYLNTMMIILAGVFAVLLSILLIKLAIKTLKKDRKISKKDFKRAYLNKLNLLRRRCKSDDLIEVLEDFSKTMRKFLSKVLGIKYEFTYDELVNELIIKKTDESVKKDIIKFSREMLEKSYTGKKPTDESVEDLIEKGMNIIGRI